MDGLNSLQASNRKPFALRCATATTKVVATEIIVKVVAKVIGKIITEIVFCSRLDRHWLRFG